MDVYIYVVYLDIRQVLKKRDEGESIIVLLCQNVVIKSYSYTNNVKEISREIF